MVSQRIGVGRSCAFAATIALCLAVFAPAQDELEYQVVIKDGATSAIEIQLPIDPTVRISPQHSNNLAFGLTVNNVRITCSPQGSIWPVAKVDGVMVNQAFGGAGPQMQGVKALVPGPTRKARHGFQMSWKANNIDFTQIVEVVPSKPLQAGANAKRQLDTCLITYIAENKDTKEHAVAVRSNIDILVNNNDGALYASPETEPGKILNGVVLADKKLPPYLLVLERADVKNPGFTGVMTFKFGGRLEGPSKVVLTNLGMVGGGAWDIQAQPAGDSACAIYWSELPLKPGQKREMVYAYGGGVASNPDHEGKVTLGLAGNLEPGKLFTLSALVEDPVLSQTLSLELPAGIERVEGAEIQTVPAPMETNSSMVLWKARVTKAGDFDLKVRSSTGVTQTKSVSIRKVGGR